MSDRVLELLTGGWRSRIVSSAARLGAFDAIAEGAAGVPELAVRLGLHETALSRLLRLLAGLDLVSAVPGGGEYRLTEAGAVLTSSHPSSLRPLVDLYEEDYFDAAWRELETGLREGATPFRVAFGVSVFDYLATHPQEASRYVEAIGAGAPHGAVLADAVHLDSPRLVVDLGGGDGRMLAEILAAEPEARGVLVERPDVAAQAADALVRKGLGDRAEVVGGDFRTCVPVGADVYVLSRVLHNWSDASCTALLRDIGSAAAHDGRILVVERMIRDGGAATAGDALALLFDLHMFVMTEGRERAEVEYARLAGDAGLVARPAVPLHMGFSVLPLLTDVGTA